MPSKNNKKKHKIGTKKSCVLSLRQDKKNRWSWRLFLRKNKKWEILAFGLFEILKRKTPSILEPNFDLFGFNVGKYGALSDELLPPQGTWLRAFSIDPLQSLNLLWCVPHILAWIHLVVGWVLVHRKCHHSKHTHPILLLTHTRTLFEENGIGREGVSEKERKKGTS